MLYGRARECARIDDLIRAAAAGRGGALVLPGEPGIGKTALLDHAAEARSSIGPGPAGPDGPGLRILRTAGTAPEAELGYAGLQRLLRPVLDLIDLLPGPQADALRIVLGHRDGPAPDRFLVGLAALSLLSEAATADLARGPVLCLVDDAHWLDDASLDVLGFLARRIEAEPVAMLITLRGGADRDRPDRLAGLPALPLSGLDRTAAGRLLADRGLGPLSEPARERLLRATGGNPLALLELPVDALTPARAGEPVPLGEELRRAFQARLEGYGPEDRTLLLVLAAAGAAPYRAIEAAAARLDVTGFADRLERLGEVVRTDGAELDFRHPLLRSACYAAADPSRRRAVHTALAEAWTDDPDRRAWQLARAATGAAEPVAEELERAARSAARRTGPDAALGLLVRAAELSEHDGARARRLLAAADAAVRAGDHDRATGLLDRVGADAGPADPVQLARLRALTELRRGVPADALALIEPVLDRALAELSDPAGLVQLLMVYGEAAYQANRAEPYQRLAGGLERLPLDRVTGEPGVLLRMLRGACRARAGRPPGVPEADLAGLTELSDPYALCWAGGLLWGLGDPAAGRRLRQTAMRRARSLGAVGALAWVLDYVVADELGDCRFDLAEAAAEEGHRFALETGQPTTAGRHLAWLALLASLRGRDNAVDLAEEALAVAERHRIAGAAAMATRALALHDLAAGRTADALRRLVALDRGDTGHPGIRLVNVADLVEAAVRAGRPEQAQPAHDRHLEWVGAGAGPELRAIAARCRALLGEGSAALAAYREALECHADGGRPFEEARTRLLYGEQLRRERRLLEAREELRTAADAFRRLGTTGWADRAETELRAAGGAAAGADGTSALDGLSPQELRIAVGVGEGLTNREIAAQLFLSPRTVDYHLRKVFQ
ncbi:MAG TPA: LuxR family transcriptional regulator, partial [Microlunatus sp.]|nr:LuxR family transcriptional regulator [Microlunatus sp.]